MLVYKFFISFRALTDLRVMTEVYVFKIVGDWQVVPTQHYELDFVKAENEVVLRPSTPGGKDDKEYRIKWEANSIDKHLHVFPSAVEAIKFVRTQTDGEGEKK